jgi:hypothetical protein
MSGSPSRPKRVLAALDNVGCLVESVFFLAMAKAAAGREVVMRVRHVGFFSDLPYGIPSEPSIRSLVAEQPHPDEERLVGYLNDGVLFIASPGVVFDVLEDDGVVIGAANILTDGVWAWPGALSYYVARYHLRIPDEFIDHARGNRWFVPRDIRVDELRIGV